MNPAVGEIGGIGRVWIFTILDKYVASYFTDVDPKTTRATIIREANTNGVWCWQDWDTSKTKTLTYLNAGSILGFKFPEEGTQHDEVNPSEETAAAKV